MNLSSNALFDEGTYYAKASSFFMTHLRLPFELEIFELRHAVTFNPPLPAIVIGYMALIFDQNLPVAWAICHFIFPSLSLSLAILLSASLVGRNAYAWLTGLIFCTFGQGPQSFLMLTEYGRAQPLVITRIEPQAFGLPLFLLFLFSAARVAQGDSKRWRWICGLASGLLFYVYFFFYSLTPLVLACLLVFFGVCGERKTARAFFLTGIVSFLIAIPWILQIFMLTPSGYVGAEVHSSIMAKIRDFSPYLIIIVAVIIFTWRHPRARRFVSKVSRLWKEFRETEASLFLLRLLPILFAVITALMAISLISPFVFPLPETTHYVQRVVIGFSILIVLALFPKTRPGRKAASSLHLMLVAICVLIGFTYVKQVVFWEKNFEERRANSIERAAEGLVRSSTETDSVIAVSDPMYNVVLPSRVHRYRFYADISRSVVNPAENLQRFVFISKLLGKPWNEVENLLSDEKRDRGKRLVKGYNVPRYLTGSGLIDKEELSVLRIFYHGADGSFLKNRRLDYLIVPKSDRETFLLMARNMNIAFKETTSDQLVSLYKKI